MGRSRKVIIGVLAVAMVLSAALFFWVRSVFTQDIVRTTLAAQLSKSLGQPVSIGGLSAGIFPRITLTLKTVAIGRPARIQVDTMRIGTDLRAMLSRRIEHATLRLSGARVELPLPPLAATSEEDATTTSSRLPVELVSIDEILLTKVEILSGGRRLTGDVALAPGGNGVQIQRAKLVADKTAIDITGRLTDLSGPSGELTVKAGALNFYDLLTFVSAFAGGSGFSGSAEPARPVRAGASAMNIGLSLEADSASFGTLVLQKLSGHARVTPAAVTLDPIGFGLFGGKYVGTLRLTLGTARNFRLKATLSDVDMAAVMKFAGNPDAITGRMSGTILDLSGSAAEASRVINSTAGHVRVDITNGTVKNLGLVRSVVVATSGRSGSSDGSRNGPRDEPFAHLGATLAVANGVAHTDDLRFESNDLLMAAAGNVQLDGSAINLAGQVQLSDKLSKEAGRDLVRYTQEQGRVTLPVTITGSAGNPQVVIDVVGLARRAVENKAREGIQDAIKKKLGGLFGRSR
jgi:uncharacterized protein involved in outer membrane biogenesis